MKNGGTGHIFGLLSVYFVCRLSRNLLYYPDEK